MLLLFIISFLMFISFHVVSSFTFSSQRDPSHLRSGFYTPFTYFQPKPSRSDSRHFVLRPFQYLLAAGASVLRGHYLPTGVFYLGAPSPTFLPAFAFIKASFGAVLLPWDLQGFIHHISSLRITGPAHLLV